jgi:O-methyltransferase
MRVQSALKVGINKVVRRFGLELRPASINPLPERLPDAEAYVGPEDFSRLYRPWRTDDAREYLTPAVLANTFLSAQKLYFLKTMMEGTLSLGGDIFEAGTGSGGSSRLMLDCQKRQNTKKPMWLLDTFEGYPKVDPALDGTHLKINECRCRSFEEVRELLKDGETICHLIKGIIPETLKRVRTEKLCFAHIDVNLHEPTHAATQFCLERLVPGGVIVFDDYCWPLTYGARLAIDEVCKEFGQHVVSIPESTQAFVIKR